MFRVTVQHVWVQDLRSEQIVSRLDKGAVVLSSYNLTDNAVRVGERSLPVSQIASLGGLHRETVGCFAIK